MSGAGPAPHSQRPMGNGALPNLIIIGAMKCATSSLHYYLGLHPDIAMSRQKELHYFVETMNWGRGEAWYRSWFDGRRSVRGEASPGYTAYPQFPGVPERMHAVVPDARLIYLVRDPLVRLLSHYQHNATEGREMRTIDEALADPDNPYLQRSCYFMQVGRYLEYFPRERILIVEQERLLRFRVQTLRHIFDFLGVDSTFRDIRFRWERHRSGRKRQKTARGLRLARTLPMRLLSRVPGHLRWPIEDLIYRPFSRPLRRPALAPALHAEVVARLRDDADRLRAFADRPFAEWSV